MSAPNGESPKHAMSQILASRVHGAQGLHCRRSQGAAKYVHGVLIHSWGYVPLRKLMA